MHIITNYNYLGLLIGCSDMHPYNSLNNGVLILELLIENEEFILKPFPGTGYNTLNTEKFQFCKQPVELNQDRF